MTNHPNRNWRARMQTACDAFLSRWRWPDGVGILTPDHLRDLMRRAYQAGYTDRHQRDHQPKT